MADVDGSAFVFTPSFASSYSGNVVDGILYDLGAEGAGVSPTVTLVSPAVYNAPAKTEPVVVDVTDPDSPFRRILITVVVNGEAFTAFDGNKWRDGWKAFSSISNITDGFRFSIRRDNGWPPSSPVIVEVYPFDTTGNEGT